MQKLTSAVASINKNAELAAIAVIYIRNEEKEASSLSLRTNDDSV